MNFDEAIVKVLMGEGGFVNHPNDYGKATNFGITQATLSAYRKSPASVDDVRNLSSDEAKTIYRKWYWCANKCNLLPKEIRGQFFDMCVNSGGSAATSLLQRAINALGGHLTVDGGIGPLTIQAALDHRTGLNEEFSNQREAWYRRVAQNNPSQAVFLQGWLNRVAKWR